MHPTISAWIEYKRLADIQPSYWQNRHAYAHWIIKCKWAHAWFKATCEKAT